MKIRSLAILSMLVMGASCLQAGEAEGEGMGHHHHKMIKQIFGDNDKISKRDFLKHFSDKFDAIAGGGAEITDDTEITKDQAIAFFKEKRKKHMQEKYCDK